MLVIENEGRFEGFNGTPVGFDNEPEEDVLGNHDFIEAQESQGACPHWACKHCNKMWYISGTMVDGEVPEENYNDEKRTAVWNEECPNKHQKKTKVICLHAESNAITKVAKSHASTIGGTMYSTLGPCFECAKLIIQCEIARVVYSEIYPLDDHSGNPAGLKLLEEAGIMVDKLDMTVSITIGHERELEDNDNSHYDVTEDLYRQP